MSNYLSSVAAEFVYFILVEARNCVELFFLGCMCGRVCVVFWWRPEIVSNNFSVGCGRVCVVFSLRPDIVSNYFSSVVAERKFSSYLPF